MSSPVIPIACAASDAAPCAPSGCGACLSSVAGPVCRNGLATAAAPALSGPPELLQRVVAELDRALAVQTPDQAGAPTSLVQSLDLREGEAELRLAVAPHCGGAPLLDAAFQALRRLLPDTDIYVSGAA